MMALVRGFELKAEVEKLYVGSILIHPWFQMETGGHGATSMLALPLAEKEPRFASGIVTIRHPRKEARRARDPIGKPSSVLCFLVDQVTMPNSLMSIKTKVFIEKIGGKCTLMNIAPSFT